MPITCRFIPDHSLAVFTHVGDVSDEEFFTSYHQYLADPAFDKSGNLLIDLRTTTSTLRGTDALRKMADYMRGKLADVHTRPKVAVLAPNDLSFGLARMYEVFSDSIEWEFTVFRALDAALAWIGAPPDLFE